jgi:hypothetical protein
LLSAVQRFCSIVETIGQSAEPPKFMTPAEKTLAPAGVVYYVISALLPGPKIPGMCASTRVPGGELVVCASISIP